MTRYDVRHEYFNWLTDLVCEGRLAKGVSYDKLLSQLHHIEFRYSIPKDENRAANGVALRYRFAYEHTGIEDRLLRGPCSVLEMMIALSARCEEIMDDTSMGDRLGQWFWGMITNLGLGGMRDERYDERLVEDVIERFLDREYDPDGRGGLFTIRGCDYDLRRVEIWTQLMWYLDSII